MIEPREELARKHVVVTDDYINKRTLLNILTNMRLGKDFEMQRAAENEEYDIAWVCQVQSRELEVTIKWIKEFL